MSPNAIGALCAAVSVIFFSINDGLIKFLSDDFALHQVILLRSVFGLFFVMVLIAPLTGGLGIIRTKRLRMHLLRGFCVFLANMTFFLGLAAMPLADAVAIFFVNPLILTIFSILFLKETVGIWRWAAILIGFAGVLVIVQPGTEAFQMASLFPLAAAIAYACINTITRYIGTTESAETMAFYIQVVFIVVCLTIGLLIGDGRFAVQDDPSLQFFFRAWSWPETGDYPVLIYIGFGIAIASYFISQAYRLGEAAFVAPFEYLAIPLSALWGILFFAEWPTPTVWLGIALITGAGLLTVWREQYNRRLTTKLTVNKVFK